MGGEAYMEWRLHNMISRFFLMCSTITNNTVPDRTYLIDIDPVIGLRRSMRHCNKDVRFENKSIEYHKRVREAYLQIANNNDRYLIIDGTTTIEKVNNIITQDINNRLLKR